MEDGGVLWGAGEGEVLNVHVVAQRQCISLVGQIVHLLADNELIMFSVYIGVWNRIY